MAEWLIKLLDQWAIVRAAPIPFVAALIVTSAAVWVAIAWSYSGIVASKNAQIELQDRQLADYKQKLDGATPDQARAKIDDLEKTISLTIGSKWEPLTKPEIDALSAKLALIPKKIRVQIMFENALGKDLAQSFYDAFRQAGWDGATFSQGSGLGVGVTTGQGADTAVALKTAIEAASKIKVEVLRADQPEWPGLVFLAVGINSAQ